MESTKPDPTCARVFPDFRNTGVRWWLRLILWPLPWVTWQDGSTIVQAKCWRGRWYILRERVAP